VLVEIKNQQHDKNLLRLVTPKILLTKRTSTKLTSAQKAAAKARAKAAGRKYPNLVDNAAVARKSKKGK